ncbi:hypothetical protein [Caproicibacter fermentans]|uniref:Uncharacterized protein n=1 Tax=Caproicibacter fermentans TaxID=2576756 RepID=A0A7G8T6V4_9FIRM|nr:hypothetical protein [Caproicibacter fermentans]QNK39345.1 hypothetical protein HCR03_11320 [Caproicibacter fermentans]
MVLSFAISTTTFSETAFAASPEKNTITTEHQQSLADAKEYLTNYSKVEVNEFGKQFTTEYQFKTSQDLDAAANYIVEYGLDAFNEAVKTETEKVVSQESQSELIRPQSTTPTTAVKTKSKPQVGGSTAAGTHLLLIRKGTRFESF